MSNRVMIGSKVKHDYTGEVGEVVAYRRDDSKHNYQVAWSSGRVDWMKREVLILL